MIKTEKLDLKETIIARLKTILKHRGLTQREFAALISKKEAEVSRWFSGKCAVSKSNLAKIENVLHEPLLSDNILNKETTEVHIGIIGTGNIAQRFVKESAYVNGVKVIAAYNPNVEQVIRFCSQNTIEHAFSSLDSLFSICDAVYVASPVDTHYDYIKASIVHGCHVLCEMPFTRTRQEVQELWQIAAKKALVLLPALKTAYCPSFLQVLRVARLGIIGEVVDVSSTVTNLLPNDTSSAFSNERMMENITYPLLMCFKLFGQNYGKLHAFVKREGDKSLFLHAYLEYADAMGDFKVGVGVKSEGSLVISGTKGYVYVPAPWWKPDYFEVRFENPADNKKYFFPYESDGLRYEIQALYDCINGKNGQDYVTKDELLKMTEVQNKIFKTSLPFSQN